jgi:hypothetical protein
MPAKRHGLTHTPTYTCWVNMRRRCYHTPDKSFPDYGGRGIVVCERWHVFDNFIADMGVRPDAHSLERRDNNGNYSPENCRWATKLDQANNTRANRLHVFDGRAQTVEQWARERNSSAQAIRHRLRRGWSISEALTQPFRVPGVHVPNFHSDHDTMSAAGRKGAESRWRRR